MIKDQHGVTALEYSLIGAAVAMLLAIVLGDGTGSGMLYELKTTFEKIIEAIRAAVHH
ncbi:Flp family type IVb pilin [Leminorella grimontii]|uniref:Flp family type IVb pilin n=1 Tax=Leminorella grimontii TaxID=82981 RepID=UPI0021C3729D|nr:Flp family type IVb pilin [Leminorella grimontii]